MIDMVAAFAGLDFYNIAVHWYILLPAAADCNTSCSVVASREPGCLPFVFGEAFVVFGVYDGEFALREWYSPEGIAAAEAAIE